MQRELRLGQEVRGGLHAQHARAAQLAGEDLGLEPRAAEVQCADRHLGCLILELRLNGAPGVAFQATNEPTILL